MKEGQGLRLRCKINCCVLGRLVGEVDGLILRAIVGDLPMIADGCRMRDDRYLNLFVYVLVEVVAVGSNSK